MKKGDKKIIRGWISYDWANSVYNLVISSSIFPIFFEKSTLEAYINRVNSSDLDSISNRTEDVTSLFFGFEVTSSILYSYTLSLSFLVVSFLSPFLSGIADYSGNKKKFMRFFCYLGSLSCISLYFFDPNNMEVSMLSFFLASIGFWCSLVFYNSFLPEIVEPRYQDSVSAKGFMMGYIGGVTLLIICLIWYMVLGFDIRYCFIFVGLWWISFSQITYNVLPNNVYNRIKNKNIIWKGFTQLKVVFLEFKNIKRLKRFLFSFFFFNTGVQTVMLTATLYASKEIFKIPNSVRSTLTIDEIISREAAVTTNLIIAILLIQILAAIGAILIAKLSKIIGNIKTIKILIGFWIPLCVFAYFLEQGSYNQFYILASGVGLVMGGIQSLSRSTYSKMLPETENHASYFSFYDIIEKIGIVLGTFFFGFMEYIMNDIRASILSIIFFFVVGFLMMYRVPDKFQN